MSLSKLRDFSAGYFAGLKAAKETISTKLGDRILICKPDDLCVHSHISYVEHAHGENPPLTWLQIFERWSEDPTRTFYSDVATKFKITDFKALGVLKEIIILRDSGQFSKISKKCIDDRRVRFYAKPPEPEIPIEQIRRGAYITKQYVRDNACGDWFQRAEKELFGKRDRVSVYEALGWCGLITNRIEKETATNWLQKHGFFNYHEVTGVSK